MYYVELEEVNDNDNFVLGNCCEFSNRSYMFKILSMFYPFVLVYFIVISNLNKGLATTKHFIIL